MLSFFPRGVLDEILNLIESVSEGFPSYSFILQNQYTFSGRNSSPVSQMSTNYVILNLTCMNHHESSQQVMTI